MEEPDKQTRQKLQTLFNFKRISERKIRDKIPNYENLTNAQRYDVLNEQTKERRHYTSNVKIELNYNNDPNGKNTKKGFYNPHFTANTREDLKNSILEDIEINQEFYKTLFFTIIEADGTRKQIRRMADLTPHILNSIRETIIKPSVNYELTPFKFNKSLDIDGTLKNEEWNTTRGACSYEYIKNVVANKARNKKKNMPLTDNAITNLMIQDGEDLILYKTDLYNNILYDENNEPIQAEEITTETILKYGCNIKLLKNLFKNLKMNLNIIRDNKVISYEYSNLINKHNIFYVFVENNHIYPITDQRLINQYKRQKVAHTENINKKANKTEPPTIENIEYNEEGLNYKNYLYKTIKANNKAPKSIFLNVKKEGTILNPFMIGETQYNHKNLTENKETHEYIKNIILPTITASYISPLILNFIYDTQLKNRNHINTDHDIRDFKNTTTENLNIDDLNNGIIKIPSDVIYKIDLNKAHRHAMENLQKLYIYDLDTEIIEINHLQGEGLYFIETGDDSLFTGNKLYTYEFLAYATVQKIEFKILYFMKNVILQENTIEKAIQELEKESTDTAKNKNIINTIAGTLGKLEKHTIKASITQDLNKWFEKIEDEYYNYYDTIEDLYIYGKEKIILKNKSHLPIYIQILDAFNIHLHKTTQQIGGQIKGRFCDAFFMIGGNPQPNNKIGGYKFEKITEFCLDRQRHKNNDSKTKQIIDPTTEGDTNKFKGLIFPTIKYSKFNNSTQADQIIEEIEKNGGGLITGDAGTGKSFIIKKLKEIHGEENIECLAFTNTASLNIGGQTIHSAFNLSEENNNPITYKFNKKWLVIDEIGMIPKNIFQFLIELKAQNHQIKMLLLGDAQQLPPVNDGKEYNIFNNINILKMTNYLKINLDINHRATDSETLKVFNNIKKGNYTDINNIKDFKHNGGVNICYYNNTRRTLNELINKQEAKGKKIIKIISKIDTLELNEKPVYKKHKIKIIQDVNMFIYKGINLIALKANKANNILKNEIYKVQEASDVNIKLNDREFTHEQISELFTLSYAISVYKAQGKTYKEIVNIHDIEALTNDPRRIYTAVSRATNIKNVNYFNGSITYF